MSVTRTFGGEFSNEEVFAWIDDVIDANGLQSAKRIRVSNSLHTRGISGKYRDIPIAMNPELYPDDQVQVVFDDEELPA